MTVTLVLTDVGLAKIREALTLGTSVNVTKFKLGATGNYTPLSSQTGLMGSTVYDDTSLNASTNASITVIQTRNNPNFRFAFDIALHLNGDIGDFTIGEFGLYLSDNTPLVFGVFNPTYAKRKSSSSKPGTSINIKATIGFPAHQGSYTVV